jgi:hypothetical protein
MTYTGYYWHAAGKACPEQPLIVERSKLFVRPATPRDNDNFNLLIFL